MLVGTRRNWIRRLLGAQIPAPKALHSPNLQTRRLALAGLGGAGGGGGGGGPAWLSGNVSVLGDILVQNTTASDVKFFTDGWLLRFPTTGAGASAVDGTKVVLTVSDEGTENGVPVTKYRTITGTGRLNKSYPDELLFTDGDQPAGTWEVTLDEQIYKDSRTDETLRDYKTTVLFITVGAGFFTVGGVPSAAGIISGSRVNRLDSFPYPMPIGSQIGSPRPITTSNTIRLWWNFIHEHACNGRQVDTVEAWGKVGATTGPICATSVMEEYEGTIGLTAPSGLTGSAFKTDIDLSSFADGDVGIVSRVKPHIGPWITSTDAGIGHVWSQQQAAGWFAEYPVGKNPTPRYYAYWNQDGTGLTSASTAGVSTSSADPGPSNSYQSFAHAALAIQAKRNADLGQNNADNGKVMMRDVAGSVMGADAGAYSLQSAPSVTVSKYPLLVGAASGVRSQLVRWRGKTAAGGSITLANKTIYGVKKIKFQQVTFDSTNTADSNDGIALSWQTDGGSLGASPTVEANYYWYDFEDCYAESHSRTSTNKVLSAMVVNYFTNSDMRNIGHRTGFSVWAGTAGAVGSRFDGIHDPLGTPADSTCSVDAVNMFACFIRNGIWNMWQSDDSNQGVTTIRQWNQYNSRMDTTSSARPSVGWGGGGSSRGRFVLGVGTCGCIWGRYDNLNNALGYLSGDNSKTKLNNVVIQNLTPCGSGGYTNESPHRFNMFYQDRGYVAIPKTGSARWCAFARTVSKPSGFNDGGVDPEGRQWLVGNSYYWGDFVYDPATGGGTVATGARVYQVIAEVVPPGTALSNTAYYFDCGNPGTAGVGPQPRRTGNLRWRNGVNSKGNVNGGSIQSEGDHSVGAGDSHWMSDKRFPMSGTNANGSKWGFGDVPNYYEDDRTGTGQSANIGLGSFRPKLTGDLIGQRPAGWAVDAMDMLGTPRDNTFAGAAGALEVVPDTTPDSYSFTAVNGADLSTVYTATATPNPLTGYNTPAPISIVGGEWSSDGVNFSSASGFLPVGATLRVRLTSSGANNTAASCTTNVGGVSRTFTVTTAAAGAAPSIVNAPTLSGLNADGTADINQAVVCGTGVWNGSPSSYAYQWQRFLLSTGTWANISGANTNTYTPAVIDTQTGTKLRCDVTATNVNGSSSPEHSVEVNVFHPYQIAIAYWDLEDTSKVTVSGGKVTSWTSGGTAATPITASEVAGSGVTYGATAINSSRPGITGNLSSMYLEALSSGSGGSQDLTSLPIGSTPVEVFVAVQNTDVAINTRSFFGYSSAATTSDRSVVLAKTNVGGVGGLQATAGCGSGTVINSTNSPFSGRFVIHVPCGTNTVDAKLNGASGSVPTPTTRNAVAARLRIMATPVNVSTNPANYGSLTLHGGGFYPALTAGQRNSNTYWHNARLGL